MKHFHLEINGIPYGKDKNRGKISAPAEWTREIIRQTEYLPKVKNACIMKVTFLLPPDKYPRNLPFGSDLDNLLKRFLDALNNTIFSNTNGKDSCVVSMCVSKTKVDSNKQAGALLEIIPVSVD